MVHTEVTSDSAARNSAAVLTSTIRRLHRAKGNTQIPLLKTAKAASAQSKQDLAWETPIPRRNPAKRQDCRWVGDFSVQIRGRGYQSPENHRWNGDSPGIWRQKLSVNTTPLHMAYGGPAQLSGKGSLQAKSPDGIKTATPAVTYSE